MHIDSQLVSEQTNVDSPITDAPTSMDQDADFSRTRKMLFPILLAFSAVVILGFVLLIGLSHQVTKQEKVEGTQDSSAVEPTVTVEPRDEVAAENEIVVSQQSVASLPVDIQWQDQEISYSTSTVYVLTENLESNQNKEIVFEVLVSDLRTFGGPRVVPARNYLNIRYLSQDFPPVGSDELQLLPGQTGKMYILFSVPLTESKVTGLLGNLKNPYVVELDFSKVSPLSGSFDLVNGYKPAGSQFVQESSMQPVDSTAAAVHAAP